MGNRVKRTILIHFVDDRRHQVDRARDKQRMRVIENRRAGCADEVSSEQGCNVVPELPEIPRRVCFVETRGIEFPPFSFASSFEAAPRRLLRPRPSRPAYVRIS